MRELFTQLGVLRAHVASGYALDAVTLARGCPEVIASMTLVCPYRLPPDAMRDFDGRVLFFSGDRGPNAPTVPRVLQSLSRARSVTLREYADAAWADALADRRDEILPTLLEFLDEMTQQQSVAPVKLADGAGQVAGISYQVRGPAQGGPPVVLMPVSLARSQWDPLIDALASRYTTIVLGGAHLGFVPNLEDRMRGGYQTVVQKVVEATRPMPGESIVEIGCGSGAVARWIAQHTRGANPITALDVNGYLLREAAALTPAAYAIAYQEGDAEALPLPSDSFDVTVSFTVMEELDADRMLAEMVRVTKPGGRIGVVVRATDMRPWLNLDLPEPLLRAAEAVSGAGADDRGCSDGSLYRRFLEVGLEPVLMGPQLAPDMAQRTAERLRTFTGRIAQGLPKEQSQAFRESVRRAVNAGTMVWAEPYHCAVAIKSH